MNQDFDSNLKPFSSILLLTKFLSKMKKKLKEPLKLNANEKAKLSKFFYLPDWQFEVLIGHKCTEMERKWISQDEEGINFAILYGLRAVYTNTNKACIANYFINFGSRTYQCRTVSDAIELMNLLYRENEIEVYKDAVWKLKYEATRIDTQRKKLKLVKVDKAA